MPHFRIGRFIAQPLAGRFESYDPVTNQALIMTRGFLFSDQQDFYATADSFGSMALNKVGFPLSEAFNILLVVHSDLSADLYINDFPVVASVRVKRTFKEKDRIYRDDIADIGEMSFPEVQLAETDQMFFLWKVGWKFGFYLDFTGRLDLSETYKQLGKYHRFLLFQSVYDHIATNPLYAQMFNDGWFPFAELLEATYIELVRIYERTVTDRPALLQQYFVGFDAARIERMSQRWFAKAIVGAKKGLIEAGLDAYRQNSAAGNVQCIKTLYTEIEGILRDLYHSTHGTRPNTRQLIQEIERQAAATVPDPESLLFPNDFSRFLTIVFFRGFDVASGQVDLSRHSTAHGVAPEAEYTRARALQGVLILDQIAFYLA